MKFVLRAFLDLLSELLVALIALPILIFCIAFFELADPVVKFYDKLKNGPDNQPPKVPSSW